MQIFLLVGILELMDLIMDNVKKTKNIKTALKAIACWSKVNQGIEICGFIGFDTNQQKYVCKLEKNCSSEPTHFFAIDALNYLIFKNKYSMISVFHSHILGDENPSEFDIKMSENCCIPFLVYSLNTDKFKIYEPRSSECDSQQLQELIKKL
jgi:proteasome lid subunit RPN8/RPN11